MSPPTRRCWAILAFAGVMLVGGLALGVADVSRAATRAQAASLPRGAIYAIAVHPVDGEAVLVTGESGLYRSDTGGRSWRQLQDPPGIEPVTLVAWGPERAGLYAAGPGGLAISDDGGRTWRTAGVFWGLDVTALAVSLADSSVYVAAGERLWHATAQAVAWTELAPPQEAGRILTLAADPLGAPVLYLGAARGLYVSGDRGGSWYRVRPNLPDAPLHAVVLLTADEATQLCAVGEQGAWFSADGGVTWSSIAFAPEDAPSAPLACLYGLEALPERAAPRLPELAPHEQPRAVAFAPGVPGLVYLGTTDSLYRSANGGETWRDLAATAAGSASVEVGGQRAVVLVSRYLAGAGLLLAIVGVASWVLQTRPGSGPRARHVAEDERWDDIIAEALLQHHRVTPELLERIPPHAREHAMIRYVDAHRDQALYFQDDPPVIAPVRAARLRLFADTWAALTQSLGDLGAATAQASHLIEQLCELLGFEPLERRVYHALAGYMVEAPTLRLSLPARFPIILLLGGEAGRNDLRDIRTLMAALNAVSFFALLIPVTDSQGGAAPPEGLSPALREGAEDLIVLGYRELFGLFLAVDAESELVRRILSQVDLTVVSPYVLSGPVPPRMFFGRDYEIKLIMRTVQDRSFAIVGGRKIGKTSILNRVHRLLQQMEGYAPLYLDCHHVTTYHDFFEALAVIGEMTIDSAEPDLLRRIIVRLRGRQGDPGRLPVLLLDEVDHLLRYDLAQGTLLFRVFRSLSQEGLCRFVLCGERTLDAALRDANSPLYNFCSTLRLGYLQERDAERIVREPMQELGIAFEAPESLPQEIVALSGCHPNIVQAICQLLIERINQRQQRVIRVADLAEVRASAEFRELFFEVTWGNATTLERLITVLMADRERFTPNDVRHALYTVGIALSDAELEAALDNLVLASLVKWQGSHLTFASPAFGRVLREAGLTEGLREGLVAKLLEERAGAGRPA